MKNFVLALLSSIFTLNCLNCQTKIEAKNYLYFRAIKPENVKSIIIGRYIPNALPDSLKFCHNLTSLEIYRANSKSLNVFSICELDSLKSLVLYDCKLRALPECMRNLKNLKKLNLSHNVLINIDSICKSMSYLQEIDLSNNCLDLKTTFSNLPTSLKKITFTVQNSKFNFSMDQYHSLVAVDMSYSSHLHFEKMIKILAKCDSLASISLCRSKIKNLGCLDKYPINIRYIDLSYNKICNADALLQMTKLEEINISGNRLSHKNIKKIMALPNLRKIHLYGNKIKQKEVDNLKRTYPNITIIDQPLPFLSH